MKKNRCEAVSAITGARCMKKADHVETEVNPMHYGDTTAWPERITDWESHNVVTPPVSFLPGDATPEEQLRAWWYDLAKTEIDRTVPKAVEYSSTDLADIGHQLARTAGRQVTDEEAAELGIFFYIQGKLSRWAGAVTNGQRPSDDTLFDLGVYIRMAQRIRAAGSWPGVDL